MKQLACLIFAIFLTGAARAGATDDLAAGSEAYRLGKFEEAAKLFRSAADQGNLTAQDSLGVMYANGEGVPQDYVQAFAWFNIAAAQVPADDEGWHARLTRFRNEIVGYMKPEQIAEAERIAKAWKPKTN